MLAVAIDTWQIMIVGLHGPDVVTLPRKRFRCIFAHTRVYQQRCAIWIDNKGTYIVVVVALTVCATLHDLQVG